MSETTTAPPSEPLTVNQQEAARLAGVSVRTIARWEAEGLIKSKKVRRIRLYPVAKLKKLTGAVEED